MREMYQGDMSREASDSKFTFESMMIMKENG
jgi:hypothetical protein